MGRGMSDRDGEGWGGRGVGWGIFGVLEVIFLLS